jgi:RimJ/RimL family protein N-acetyltransferase
VARGTGTLVARGGPKCAHLAGRDEAEIGWTVVPERWDRGLATELGAASLEIAFGPLGLADVVSSTLPDNHASRRVMERLGFAYEPRHGLQGLAARPLSQARSLKVDHG